MTANDASIVERISFDSFDPEAMEQTLQRSSLEHTLLAGGRFSGQVHHAETAETRLDLGGYGSPVLAVGTLADDRVSIGCVLHAAEPCIYNAESGTRGDLLLYDENDELHAKLSPGAQWVAVQVERSLFEGLGLEMPRVRQSVLGQEPAAVERLEERLAPCLELIAAGNGGGDATVAASQAAVDDVRDALLAALAEKLRQGRSRDARDPRSSRLRLLRRAEHYLEEHLSEPVSIATLCRELDCPIHTLERAFSKVHGVSPKRFLAHRRLTRLRRLLLAARAREISITDALLDCGLHHAGRAASAYKNLFGELPADTLGRSPKSRASADR